MSTVTVPNVAVALTPIPRAETWLKQHEKLVLAVIAGFILWFGIGKVENIIAAHDNSNLQQAKVVAQVQADKTQALATQAAQQAAQYQALTAKLDAQNAQLVQANTQLATALAKQQKTDATLPPSALVARWNTLVPLASATVTTTGVVLPNAGAVATVQQLEQVPVLRTQNENERTQLGNAQSLIQAEGQQITTLTAEVSSLNVQLGDNAKVCTEQIAVVKDEARKSKRRWFIGGFVVGFLSRQAIKTYIGI